MADNTETETKNSRTSPRTTAFLSAAEVAEKNGASQEVLDAIRALIGTKAPVPEYAGTNFVAVLRVNGTDMRIPFKSSARPSARSHGKQFAAVYGPWKKVDEAGYIACLAGEASEPVVFSA